jgi:protein KRI1
MARLYDSGDEQVDAEKPHWEDDIDIEDIVSAHQEAPKKKKKKKKKKDRGDDEIDQGGVNIDEMDADVEKVVDDEEWDGTEEMRKKKWNEYMDEIYGMDFNDIVSSLFRFSSFHYLSSRLGR